MNNDKNKQQDKDLPGYPHYPANEDITRAKNNNGKEPLNEENVTVPNSFDIPGQEHITPAPLGEMADTTASSADEEDVLHGDSLDERDNETRIVMGTEADVTAEDIKNLEAADQNMDTIDDQNLEEAALDDTDNDGEPLNEDSIDIDMTGEDLDVPGSELDNPEENIGEEDEENNYYSLGGDNHEGQEEDNYTS